MRRGYFYNNFSGNQYNCYKMIGQECVKLLQSVGLYKGSLPHIYLFSFLARLQQVSLFQPLPQNHLQIMKSDNQQNNQEPEDDSLRLDSAEQELRADEEQAPEIGQGIDLSSSMDQQRHPKDREGSQYKNFMDVNESHLLASSNGLLSGLPQNKWRAKLYQLNSEGCWDDFGTGQFQILRQDDQDYYMILVSEDDDVTELLYAKIRMSTHYSRQRDTIITWMDEDTQVDLALSFQDSKGAQETWESICLLQGKDPNELMSQDEAVEEEVLPQPSYDNLAFIAEELAGPLDLMKKRKISSFILQDNAAFLRRIGQILENAEQMENQEVLFTIFMIYKGLLSLGDTKLIETLLSTEFYLETFGALEYDPEAYQNANGQAVSETGELVEQNSPPLAEGAQGDQAVGAPGSGIQNLNHRDFLQNQVKFRQVVKIEDEVILENIHMTYRLNYLKDTAMARFIDDQVLSNVNSLIYIKSQEIVNHIFYNKDILMELLQKMRAHHDMQAKHDAIEFFMEVCQLSKNIQLGARFSFFETMNSFNLIEVLAETFNIYQPDVQTLRAEIVGDHQTLKSILIDKNDSLEFQESPLTVNQYVDDFLTVHDKHDIKKIDFLKINAIEILMNFVQFAPSVSIRSFALSDDQKRQDYPFIKQLAQHLIYSYEQGIKIQVCEFLKSLLDNEQVEKKVEFNELFYNKVMVIFSENLGENLDMPLDDPNIDLLKAQEFNKSLEYSRSLILQVIIKCTSEHTYRFRIFAVNNELIEKISNLHKQNSKLLNLWIIKFYKAILKGKDEIFYQYLTKKHLFKTIVDIFLENPNKSNMLHSSILELFDYLNREYNYKIVTYMMTNYEETLMRNPLYEKYFRNIVAKYDGKDDPKKSQGLVTNDYHKNTLREQIRKEDEDLMSLSSNEDENSNDEDEKYNQQVFLKKKQEWEKGASWKENLKHLLMKRKSNSRESSEEEEEEIEDMGLFGGKLVQFRKQQFDKQHSPKKPEELAHTQARTSPINGEKSIQFEIRSHEEQLQEAPPQKEVVGSKKEFENYLMSPDSFVKGKRLIDPVTGRLEGEEKSDDSYEMLEKSSVSSKRSKLESDTNMEKASEQSDSQSQMRFQIQNLESPNNQSSDKAQDRGISSDKTNNQH